MKSRFSIIQNNHLFLLASFLLNLLLDPFLILDAKINSYRTKKISSYFLENICYALKEPIRETL